MDSGLIITISILGCMVSSLVCFGCCGPKGDPNEVGTLL